jgi:hypothetical protein
MLNGYYPVEGPDNGDRNDPYNDIVVHYYDGTSEVLHSGDVPKKWVEKVDRSAYSVDDANARIKNEADFQREFQYRYGEITEEQLREWNIPRTLNEAIQMGKASVSYTQALHLPLYDIDWC